MVLYENIVSEVNDTLDFLGSAKLDILQHCLYLTIYRFISGILKALHI